MPIATIHLKRVSTFPYHDLISFIFLGHKSNQIQIYNQRGLIPKQIQLLLTLYIIVIVVILRSKQINFVKFLQLTTPLLLHSQISKIVSTLTCTCHSSSTISICCLINFNSLFVFKEFITLIMSLPSIFHCNSVLLRSRWLRRVCPVQWNWKIIIILLLWMVTSHVNIVVLRRFYYMVDVLVVLLILSQTFTHFRIALRRFVLLFVRRVSFLDYWTFGMCICCHVGCCRIFLKFKIGF